MDVLKKIIKFFYYGYMSIVGCGCTLLILVFLIPFALGVTAALSELGNLNFTPKQPRHVSADGGMLVVDMSAPIVEAPTSNDMLMNYLNGTNGSIGVFDLEEKIDGAARDSLVQGVVLCGSFSGSGTPFSQAAQLRSLLERFKESGKPVYAYLENPTQTDYFVASAATKIYANPAGTLEFKGLRIKSIFLGNALKKYGVDAELIRAGKYKSAGEIFTSNAFSPASREAYGQIAGGLWDNVLSGVSKSRGIPQDTLRKIAEDKAILSADEARKAGLVDAICQRDVFVGLMTDLAGEDPFYEGTFRQASIQDYIPVDQRDGRGKSIAILYLEGQIVEGDQRVNGYITSGYYASIIRELRRDDSVAGVVLRIDSPGGSAYASEILRREIELLQKEKPVVSSFGSTAASGAYWISAGTNKIVSEENTLTGSIGVFGMVLSAEKLANGFGITFDTIETSPMADIMSGTRPMTPAETKVMQNLIDNTYAEFLKIVSNGRNIPETELEKIAQGRVWLASEAKNTRLFDEIGGLGKAVEICAQLSGEKPNAQIREYPAPEKLEERIFGALQNAPFASVKKALLPRDVAQGMDILQFHSPIRAQSTHVISIEE